MPTVYISPSSISKRLKSMVTGFSFVENDIYYASGEINNNAIVCGYGKVKKTKIEDNRINTAPANLDFQIIKENE